MDIKIITGAINFTDYLHVTVAKVSDPNTVVWEDWIAMPVSNYEFIVPGLDPDNYLVSFYDAPTSSDLGTLVSQAYVSALASAYEFEWLLYDTSALPGTASLSVDGLTLTDTGLIDEDVTELFKQGNRPLVLNTDFTFDDTTGEIVLTNGMTFDPSGEVVSVKLRHQAGTVAPSNPGGGLYVGTLDVTAATQTLSASDRNKRIRCVGSGSTQTITLCAISAVSDNDGFYFDNSCGGTAVQVVIQTPGTDRINFNGFMTGTGLFAKFWVSKGEHLLIRKYTYSSNSYWEVITDYKGVHVGERFAATFLSHPNFLPEDGRLLTAAAYPRLAWWLENVCPSSHLITDDTITSGSWTRPSGKNGLFAVTSDYSSFRMPDTQNLSERGLKDFDSYGADTGRVYDYPGGYQDEMIGPHTHPFDPGDTSGKSDNANDRDVMVPDSPSPNRRTTGQNLGTENRVKNIGVIYLRRI